MDDVLEFCHSSDEEDLISDDTIIIHSQRDEDDFRDLNSSKIRRILNDRAFRITGSLQTFSYMHSRARPYLQVSSEATISCSFIPDSHVQLQVTFIWEHRCPLYSGPAFHEVPRTAAPGLNPPLFSRRDVTPAANWPLRLATAFPRSACISKTSGRLPSRKKFAPYIGKFRSSL